MVSSSTARNTKAIYTHAYRAAVLHRAVAESTGDQKGRHGPDDAARPFG
jgi:hypothetical protein